MQMKNDMPFHPSYPKRRASPPFPEVLDNLLRLENRVMDYWNVKKRRLDWCQQYVLVERSARQALDWIKDTGEELKS